MSELRRSVREGRKVWFEVGRRGRPLVRPLTLPWEPHSHMLYTDSIVPRCTCATARQCFWCTCERERANYQTTVLRLGFWSGKEVVVP